MTIETAVREEEAAANARADSLRQFMAQAFKRFETAETATSETRQKQVEDWRWAAGGTYQWDSRVLQERMNAGRPALTVNRFPAAVGQVVNGEAMTQGAIRVHPVDSGADVKTAEVLQGIIRHIETKSIAPAIYRTAARSLVISGVGAWRVLIERENERSFDYCLRIKPIPNVSMLYCDPSTTEPDRRDMRFAFLVRDMPKDEYHARYPDSDLSSLERFRRHGDAPPNWMPEGHIRVAEYFYVEEEPDVLMELSGVTDAHQQLVESMGVSGVMLQSELMAQQPEWFEGDQWPAGVMVSNARETTRRTVKWCVINGERIIEGNEDLSGGREWPGSIIPIVVVTGDEYRMDGQVDHRGIVRDARDPQRIYNYEVTAQVEMIQTSKTAPWIAPKGSFDKLEAKWRYANVKNFPYLEYNPQKIGDQVLPPPTRVVQEPPIAAITQAIVQADHDIKSLTGWHDASLGEQGPEESGIAIQRRQHQDRLANDHYPQAMNLGKKLTGDMLVELVPKVYQRPKVIRILGVDESQRAVMVHAGSQDVPDEPPDGVDGIYDLGVGTFDTVVSVGASYQTQRQEVNETVERLLEKSPQFSHLFLDLFFRNLDSPIGERLGKRAEFLLPQGVRDAETQRISPAAMQQITELQQQLQMLQQQLQAAVQKIQTDEVKAKNQFAMKQLDVAARERTSERDAVLKAELAGLDAQVQMAEAQLRASAGLASEQRRGEIQQTLESIKGALAIVRDAAKADVEAERQIRVDKHAASLLPRGAQDGTEVVV